MTEEKNSKTNYISHNDFLAKMQKKAAESAVNSKREKSLPQSTDVYVNALAKLYRSDDSRQILDAVLALENEQILKILSNPFGDHAVTSTQGMDFSQKAAFNAGLVEGLRMVQKFREANLKKYQEILEKTKETENES